MAISPRTTRRGFLTRTLALGAAGLAAGPALLATPNEARAASSDGWQISIFTRPFAQHEYGAALDAIAEAGFKHLGLMTIKSKTSVVISMESTVEQSQQVGDEARKRGLKIVSVYAGNFPVVKESLEPGIKGLRRMIDNTAACGCASLLLGGIGGKDQEESYYKTIGECCDYAAEKGVLITLKPHGPLNGTGPECRERCEKVNHKNFAVWYDPGNIAYYSEGKIDPARDAASVDGLVRGMSVKDYRKPQRVDVTPGDGEVNFPAVMARLKQGGFTAGPLVIECLSPGDLATLVAEAKKARRFVEDLIRTP